MADPYKYQLRVKRRPEHTDHQYFFANVSNLQYSGINNARPLFTVRRPLSNKSRIWGRLLSRYPISSNPTNRFILSELSFLAYPLIARTGSRVAAFQAGRRPERMPSTKAMSIPARALSMERVMVRTSDTALTGMETSSTSRMPVRPPARERKDASTMNWVRINVSSK